MPRIRQYRDEYLKRDLTDFLANERRHKKITQKQLADELGIQQPRYSSKERKADFKYSELIILFRKLGTDKEQILKLMGAK